MSVRGAWLVFLCATAWTWMCIALVSNDRAGVYNRDHASAQPVTPKLNVLFIVVDDLRASLSCYGGPIISPNIDQLASRSAVFTNAMVQQSVCAPSRVSFLTGRRPDTTKLYSFGSYWRTHAGNYTTLPQHFKDNGYTTLSMGKVFHPGVTSGWTDDYPYSWSLPTYHPSTQRYQSKKLCLGKDGKLGNNVMCPVNVSDMPKHTLPDLQSLQTAKDLLKILHSPQAGRAADTVAGFRGPAGLREMIDLLVDGRRSDAGVNLKKDPEARRIGSRPAPWQRPPFFLAVGIHKPHMPWRYPQEYQSLYPLDSVQVATNPNIPERLPSVAWEDYYSLRQHDDIRAMNLSFPWGTIPLKNHAAMRQNYYAATTYTDYLVGSLLKALDDNGVANNTIVTLVGDHGWQLGEHAEWCKYSNFELATRVPLIVHVPGVTDVGSPTTGGKFPLIDVLTSVLAMGNHPWRKASERRKGNRASSSGAGRSQQKRSSELYRGKQNRNSVEISEFVELVDLFPSLSEMAGLSVPPVCPPSPFNVSFCTEGYSFAPLIHEAACRSHSRRDCRGVRWKNATFSQYPRPGVDPNKETDVPTLDEITVMGYSMRSALYHYTEWIGFNHTTLTRDWADVKARELYLNDLDPDQNSNVADQSKYKDVVALLSQQLRRGWRDSLPVSRHY